MFKKTGRKRVTWPTTYNITLSHFLHNITSSGACTVLERSSSCSARSYVHFCTVVFFARYCTVFLQPGPAIECYPLYDVATHKLPFSVVIIEQDCTLHRSRTIVAPDRLTNAVAMSSGGFSSRSCAIQVGHSLLRETSMKCLYFTLINSSWIVEIAVSDEGYNYVGRWRHTFNRFHY